MNERLESAESDAATRDADAVVDRIAALGSVAVAFSAGVDSTVVAKAAHMALGERAVAVTGSGAALSPTELEDSRRLAQLIGVRHEVVATAEIENDDYVANGPTRCFHCKTELYSELRRVADTLGLSALVNGANHDDLGDYRPGMQAAKDFHVYSPLLECGLGKQEVRRLARLWSLPVWDKPAAPCLASRIAYGVEVTPERLQKIDLAEQWVRAQGPREVRVRLLEGDQARVETPKEWTTRFLEAPLHERLLERLHSLGFKSVLVDPDGYRSGKLNDALPMVQLSAQRDS